jgi:hypothetical protein
MTGWGVAMPKGWRPAQQLRHGLRAGRANGHGPLAAASSQAAQPIGDAPVQVPDGGEFLTAGQRLTWLHGLTRRCGRDKADRVLAFHAFGSLQVQEVLQRLIPGPQATT